MRGESFAESILLKPLASGDRHAMVVGRGAKPETLCFSKCGRKGVNLSGMPNAVREKRT
jgi:hypothetical protein